MVCGWWYCAISGAMSDVYNGPIIGVDVIPNIKLNALPKNAALMVDRSLDLMLSKQRQTNMQMF